MIQLLTAITLSESGGSQRVVYDLVSNLPEDRYEITLITSPGGELVDWLKEINALRANKIKVIEYSCFKRELSPLDDLLAFFRLFAAMAGKKFDIAHFHNSKMGIVGRLAAKLAGVPAVYYTVHGWGLNPATAGKLYGAMSFAERIAARASSEIVFVSNADRETGLENRWAREAASRVIYNGIGESPPGCARVRETLGIAPKLPVLAFVARLAEPKDPLFAMKVSETLAARGFEHRLLIVGDGPLRTRCDDLAREQSGQCRTVFLGHRTDARAILGEADVFCLFTKWEGLPVSVIEAMFSGLPVVASAVGGVPELVRHGRTGYLLEGFDCEKATGYLSELICDRELRLRMGRAGREEALQRFTLDGMLAGYRRLYEEPGVRVKARGRAAWERQSVRQKG